MALNQRQDKTIVLPFASEEEYDSCLQRQREMRQHLLESHEHHPELFPPDFEKSFHFHDVLTSKKLGLNQIRIKLKANKQVYQVRPSFVMPYMIARTDDVEKALFLRLWAVPYGALTYVFGRDDQFWYQASNAMGRYSLVGSTCKADTSIPADLCADEKHTRRAGKKNYIATTTGNGCFLGAALTESADTASVTVGYGEFQQESQAVDRDYHPKTVNTDGWEPTQQAWKALYPVVTVIQCFFHAWLSIKKRCRRATELLKELGSRIWTAFCSPSLAIFSQRIRRLRE